MPLLRQRGRTHQVTTLALGSLPRHEHCQVTCLHSALMHRSWALYLAGGKQPELTEFSRLAPWLLERRCAIHVHNIVIHPHTNAIYLHTSAIHLYTSSIRLHTRALCWYTSVLCLHTRAMNTDCSNDALPSVPAQRICVELPNWPASLPHAKTAPLT